MAEWTVCAHCGLKHSLRADGLCPRCRKPLGAGPTEANIEANIYAPPRSALEPVVAAPRPPAALPIERPVFNARALHAFKPDVLYRLYLLPGEGCFVRVEGQGLWWILALVLRGGFGLLGALLAPIFQKQGEERLLQKVRELDAQDPRFLVTATAQSFPLTPAEIAKSTLEASSIWSGFGLWRVVLRDGRTLKFRLESSEDTRIASQAVPAFVGAAHGMEAEWDPRAGKLVKLRK